MCNRWDISENGELSTRNDQVWLKLILLNVISKNVNECISSWNKFDQKHFKNLGYGSSGL